MVTDITSNYSSPAGKEFTIAAGRFAGLLPGSRVFDMGCGYGDGACNLAVDFRCRVRAVDISAENITIARKRALDRKVSHLIDFAEENILRAEYSQEPFDMVMAEGGILSFVGRRLGLECASKWLVSRGWFAFSDLVLISETNTPAEVLAIFENDTYKYETEASYRILLSEAGFVPHLVCMVPQSGWDNYYAHMARRLEDSKGFFADKKIKLAFHKEIDVFYRLEGFRYIGYLVCVARRKNE
jgi:ubiquinone/menaquinone biosynthesis C-methylase UbiE